MANRYTGELWHYGIHGQKWGVRRYQNKDGSLTPLGREHYGYGPPREKIGSAKSSIKRGAERLGEGIARGIKSKLAEKMPFMLNDEELERYNNRLMKEANYKNALANKRDAARRAKGTNFIKKLAEDSATRAVNNIIDPVSKKVGNRLAETGSERAVRKSNDLSTLARNSSETIENESKAATKKGIDDYVKTYAKIRDNEVKMWEIEQKSNDQYNRKPDESQEEYEARLRNIRNGNDFTMNKLTREYNRLVKETDQLYYENYDREEDLALRRNLNNMYSSNSSNKESNKESNKQSKKER